MARRTIAGKRAIVTGASGGIGRAIAVELARQGADVLAVARREPLLKELVDKLRQLGPRAEYVAGDICDAVIRQQCLDFVKSQFGGLDILINNAGIGAVGPFATASPESLRQIFELNFFAAAELTQYALPLLSRGQQPLLVNVSSILGHCGIPQMAGYCASKFALRGFSESLRAELKPQGIDVLIVSPGSTSSDFFSNLIEDQSQPSWRASQPSTPEHVAQVTVRAMRRGAHEVFPSPTAQAVYALTRLSPRLLRWIIARRS